MGQDLHMSGLAQRKANNATTATKHLEREKALSEGTKMQLFS